MDSKQRSSTNCKCQVNRGVLDLPREMISEILCRLPTESILICRVVCKTWYAITQDPSFINALDNSHYQPTRLLLKPLPIKDSYRHTRLRLKSLPIKDSYRTPCYLVLVDMENHKTRRLPLEKMFEELQLTCSCNGFLCMAPPKKLDPVVIYNPITSDRSILPPSNSKYACLRQEVGFGFDASTNKYKVVRAYTDLSARLKVRRFEIISLGESSWRELNAPERIVSRDGSGFIFLSGALYWTMSEGITTIVVQFNLSDEEFRIISFPADFPPFRSSIGLIDIRGTVSLVQRNSSAVRIWRIGDGEGEGEDELSFYLYACYDKFHLGWDGELSCAFVCQMNEESYLLHVGYCSLRNECWGHLIQYFPDEVRYSNLQLQGLPDSFKTVCFKPSLVPVPK